MSRIAVIGAGFSGLSAACYLSDAGHEVHVFEKNETAGGRARRLTTPGGYVFDMGPSWYWMPSVFEKFFHDFGYQTTDFYKLRLLDPAFQIVFENSDVMTIPASYAELLQLFESIEKGSALKLDKFMKEARFKYEEGMDKLVYKPGLSFTEFLDPSVISGAVRLQVFSSFSKHVRKYFSHPKLVALMEFPVLFLGAMPDETPALYSLMNYAGLKLGTWYPEGGFESVIDAMVKIARSNNTSFHFNSPVEKIIAQGRSVRSLNVNGDVIEFDAVIASADYAHIEESMLDPVYRNYDSDYWKRKTFAPSCLIYYVGLDAVLPNLTHHTLFFDADMDEHAEEIYRKPAWPAKPLFYLCNPSKSDCWVAPPGHENLFFLMPLAPGLDDDDTIREEYFQKMWQRFEQHAGKRNLQERIAYKKSYCVSNFIDDYHSYKGNAYGLANTLRQTAVLKPSIRNKKLDNLFYTGQLTVPGPGVPPCLISGKLAAEQAIKFLKAQKNEIVV